MAYKVSYKVICEQGEQLKKTAKEIENNINQMNQIISKLGNDQLLQSVRSDLKKFNQQLETEKQVLGIAGQILADVVQSYSSTEKKSVAKVDKAKAHNRDFYKRPVVVASAGGASAVAASGGGAASASSSVNVSAVGGHQTVINNTSTVINNVSFETANAVPTAEAVVKNAVTEMIGKEGAMIGGIAATAAAGGAIAGVNLAEKKKTAHKKER